MARPTPTDGFWKYRSLTGTVGPISEAEFLLAVASGIVQPHTPVQCVESGAWLAAGEIPGLQFAQADGVSDHHATDAADEATGSAGVGRSREMRELLREYSARHKQCPCKAILGQSQTQNGAGIGLRIGKLLTACTASVSNLFGTLIHVPAKLFNLLIRSKVFYAILLISILVVLAPRISGVFTSQADAYEVLHRIWDEAKEKRADDVTSGNWTEYQSRSAIQIQKLVPVLQRKADINDPASMSLLWIARDYLPAALRGPQKIDGDLVTKIEKHFADIDLVFRRNGGPEQSTAWWIWIIVCLDAVLVLTAIWYFVGHRWRLRT